MQLYARNSDGKKVYAYSAQRGIDYFCLECNGRVRLRGGLHFKEHFFHLSGEKLCRQAGKSELHILIQRKICHEIGAAYCTEERRFSEIDRVADVAWEEKRVVFEVQCSPMRPEEALARCRDYESLGWSVVWIVSDKRFNKYRLSGFELALQKRTHYYTDGKRFYDQCHIIADGCRRASSIKKTISLDSLQPHAPKQVPLKLPLALMDRAGSWSYYATGDHLWHVYNDASNLDASKLEWRESIERLLKAEKGPIHTRILETPLVKRLYIPLRSLWHFILERSCS